VGEGLGALSAPLWRVEPTYNIPSDDWATWCGVDSSVGRAPRAILAIFFDDRNGTFVLPKPSLNHFEPQSFTASGVPQVPRQLACVVSSCPRMPRGVTLRSKVSHGRRVRACLPSVPRAHRSSNRGNPRAEGMCIHAVALCATSQHPQQRRLRATHTPSCSGGVGTSVLVTAVASQLQ